MFEQFHTLRVFFQQARPKLCQYLEVDKVDLLEQEIAERTKNHQPMLMVYGVYNAGKSTLINALLGDELAEVGDVPKTDRVDMYQMGDVVLLDTPGIDAPIEHEKITREQLARSDAVVFVLSSDGVLEERSTYEEMERILRADKPLLVVINNKSGYKPDSQAYVSLSEKFRSNLYNHFSGDESMLARLDRMPIHLVNARAALKGKLESKPALVEISRLPELTKAVQRLFHDIDAAQVAKTLSEQLQALLREAVDCARLGSKDAELVRLQELITSIRKSQTAVARKVLNHAERSKPALKNHLCQMLQDGDNGIQPVLEQWQADQSSYFEEQLRRELERLDQQAADVNGLLLNQLGHALPVGEDEEIGGGGGFNSLAATLAQKGLKQGINFNKETAVNGMIVVMKQGKKWFPTLFKGIGEKTMEKMAGKVVPFIGPCVDVAMAGWDYYQAREAEERQIRRERQQRESINQSVSALVDELYESLAESVEDSLHDTLHPLISGLQHSLESLATESSSLSADISVMETVQEKLQQTLH